MLARERDEQGAGAHEPRVGLHAADLDIVGVDGLPTDRAGHREEGTRLHRVPARAAIAVRATARSSNGITVPRTSW